MRDRDKTKEQLIGELVELRQRIAELEAVEAEHKRAEEALRESEEKFRNLAEHSPNMVFINKRGRVVYANKRCEEMMGYTTDEFYSADFDFLALIAPEHRELVKANFGKHTKGKDVEPYEFALVTKDGRRIETLLTAKLIDYDGERAILGTVTDIAERKRAEEALRESEERFRGIVEGSLAGYFYIDRDGRFQHVNDAWLQMHGYTSADEVVGQHFALTQVETDLKQAQKNVERLLSGEPIPTGEFTRRRKDGSIGYHTFSAYPVMRGEKIVGLEGFFIDVTKRKQAEEMLLESEEKYRALAENSSNGIFISDAERLIYVNPRLCEITGFSRDELLDMSDPVRSLFVPEEQERILTYARNRLDGGSAPTGYEARGRRKDGETVWLKLAVSSIILSGKRMLQGTVEDITERKWAEKEIRQRNRELKLLNRASQVINSVLDLDQVLVIVLEEVRHLLGAAASSIWLTDPETDEMVCQQAAGPHSEIVRGWRLAPGKGIAGWVARHGESLILPDVQADERHFLGVDQQIGLSLHSILSVPLQVKQNVIGALQVLDTEIGRFNTEDLTLLELLASSAAIAIENARLFEQAHREINERKQAEEALQESEARAKQRQMYLERVLASAPDAIVTMDPGHQIIEWNPGAEKLFGYSREEAIGRDLDHLITNPDVLKEATGFTLMSKNGQETGPVELVRYRKDGSPVDVILSGSPILEGKELIGTIAVYTDNTERKRVEKERAQFLAQIQEQAQRVQKIVDTVPEGVLLLDADGCVILANPLGEKDLSTLAGAKVGESISHLGDRPLDELLTSPPKGLWHEVAMHSRIFQILARSIEIGPAPGDWVMVVRDVTQQRETEQRIQQQERLAAVGQLAAGIAHDFNNIMATVVLYAQMTARTKDLPSIVRERMLTIDQQAKHATRLIQQILDFSRQAVLEQHPLDLAPLLKEHIKLLGRTLPESIEIRLELGPDEYIVNADPTRIQQMMTNLALNARDAMLAGGTLHIGLEHIEVKPGESPLLPEMETGEWVKMAVSDTGTGIPPDVLPHIFEPFFTTKAPLGNGLGLAQVHGIVGQHGGRIEVDTQVDKGTTFTIYLPALSTPEKPLSAVSSEDSSSLLLGQGQVILVVEDNATVRKTLVESLETLNYQVLEATNGQEALAMLEQHSNEIGLLLSDVVMPVMGGVALLHTLRERELLVPVVLLTGHPLHKEMEELRAQGIADWLPKPPELEQLAEVMARALGTD